MIDEEKMAMEITNDIDTMVYDGEGSCVNIYDNIERAVLVGIRTGRKELEKENAELKAEVKELRNTLDLVTAEWNKERDELKAHCKAVDEVNAKMKCCGNCFNFANLKDCGCKAENEVCENWEMKE